MNYGRNSVTGRLSSTPGVQTPSNLSAAAESPAITYPVGTTFPKDLPARKGYYGGVPEMLAQKMKQFQKPSGVPIHLKGGPIDKVLFGTTLVLCGIGLASIGKFIYDMSFPKKAD